MRKIHLCSLSVLLVLQAACSGKGGDEQDAAGDDGNGSDPGVENDISELEEEEPARDMGNDPDLSEDDLPVNAWGIISEV